MGKTDPTGTYLYVCDGTSPASPVLADGLAVYTPGLSDHRNGASTFTHADALGSLRFLTSGQTPTASLLSDAFGETVASDPLSTPFGWNGRSGYGTDWDGLTLVGHRYYDSRTGRFVSQDPVGDGDNWYAYCRNNPINHTDTTGLSCPVPGEWSLNGGCSSDAAAAMGQAEAMDQQANQFMGGLYSQLAARQAAASQRRYHRHLNAPGTVWNNSSYSIPIMFDHDEKSGKVFYEVDLPPHSYTGLEDIDFVFYANDLKARGGYDWKHIMGDTNTLDWDAAGGDIHIAGVFYPATFKGYPYNVTPLPLSGSTGLEVLTIPTPVTPPLLIGPIP